MRQPLESPICAIENASYTQIRQIDGREASREGADATKIDPMRVPPMLKNRSRKLALTEQELHEAKLGTDLFEPGLAKRVVRRSADSITWVVRQIFDKLEIKRRTIGEAQVADGAKPKRLILDDRRRSIIEADIMCHVLKRSRAQAQQDEICGNTTALKGIA